MPNTCAAILKQRLVSANAGHSYSLKCGSFMSLEVQGYGAEDGLNSICTVTLARVVMIQNQGG
jgi:hypothetical protein